ncbi:MAG: hypothetical protein PHY64_00495 [Eubacteriales bacterium]|nr:hypothetical protein [Eubacteriales bacterium]
MKAELKRAIFSPQFLLAFLVLFLAFQGYALPAYYSEWLAPDHLPLEYRESALQLTLGGIFFGGVILLIPFCSALTCSPAQVDDLRSSELEWSFIRSSRKIYALRKCTCAFIAGALATGGAFLIHACLWHILALPYDPVHYPSHEIGFWEESFFSTWSTVSHALPILVEIGLGIAFSGGIWAIVAMATALWVPDKILVLVIPTVLFKLWSANLTYYLFGFRLPSPDTLFNDAQTINGDVNCLVCYVVLLAAAILLYWGGLKRRICHA